MVSRPLVLGHIRVHDVVGDAAASAHADGQQAAVDQSPLWMPDFDGIAPAHVYAKGLEGSAIKQSPELVGTLRKTPRAGR